MKRPAGWVGPYHGVPAFDGMDLDALKPALEAGMAQQDVIANNPEPPTFENTILAMERVIAARSEASCVADP